MQSEYSIAALCGTLNVTRSGYHAWAERHPGVRAQANAALLSLITQAHQESRQTYGSPRIRIWLQHHGQSCGRQRISKLMRVAGLNSRPRRRFRPQSLTDSNPDLPVALNRLRDLAAPQQQDAVWVADITYVETAEGWLYVAGVLDRCTRRCVGWAMSDSLATTLPLAALAMALKQRAAHRRPRASFRRGVQYASGAYRQRLALAGGIPSMSRRGNGYDNAAMESFWSSLKRELVYRCLFATRAQARAAILEWIEVFYNCDRLHSALGYQSPVDCETKLKIPMPQPLTPCPLNRGKASCLGRANAWIS